MVLSTKNDMPEKDVTVDSLGNMINPATKENQELILDALLNPAKPLLQQDLIDNSKSGYADRTFRYAFGKRSGVNNTRVDLWEGPTDLYVFPSAPIQMRIVSTSASDSSAGIGARTVRIDWLDDQYELHVDEIILNGTTPVNFPFTNMLRLNYMHIATAGSSASAVGDISITNLAGTQTYGIIKPGFTVARQAIGTVPAGFNAYVNHWQASSGSVGGNHFTQITLRSDSVQGIRYPGIFLVVDEVGTQDSGESITIPIPVRIPEKTDIKISATSDANNSDVTCLGVVMGWFELM